MENPEEYLGRLKPIHLFKGLTEAQILDVARQLEIEKRPAGEAVFRQGDEGQFFYIINRGKVEIRREHRSRPPQLLAVLSPGDHFGEGSLIYGRRRSATAAAQTDVELLRLSREDFDALVRKHPQIKPNLLVSLESHELYRRLNLTWLSPNEVVYLVTRRHIIVLVQGLLLPVLLAVVVLVLAFAAWWYFLDVLAVFILMAGGLAVGGWITWKVIDWSNDYYIVTDRRVVYLEKIVGIYDSRQEAPLASVLSVNIQTAGAIERALEVGDVIVRTFSGPITMQSMAKPEALASLIEEHWQRTKTREREAEREAMKQSVRRRVGLAPPEPPKPLVSSRPAARPNGLPQQLGQFFSFKLRFEQGDAVVYRKHWFILAERSWQPSLLIFTVLGLLGLRLAGVLLPDLSLVVFMLLAFLALIPLAGWWLYEFVDWKNDIYQVTPEQILDLHKKPLGQESRKSAPLENILSLRYERPGLLGLVLNFGNVIAMVAGAEFRFEGVFDPPGVQNDIYRRIEARNARKAQAESAKRRDEIAEWLGVYHTVLSENEDQKPPKLK